MMQKGEKKKEAKMAMIKGRYVAQIEINFAMDESTEGLLPFEEIHKRTTEGLTPMLKELIRDEIDEGEVTVTQMFADVWMAEDADAEMEETK